MKFSDNISQVIALQPDYIGFIFYEKSARNFNLESIPKTPKKTKRDNFQSIFLTSSVIHFKKKNHHKI